MDLFNLFNFFKDIQEKSGMKSEDFYNVISVLLTIICGAVAFIIRFIINIFSRTIKEWNSHISDDELGLEKRIYNHYYFMNMLWISIAISALEFIILYTLSQSINLFSIRLVHCLFVAIVCVIVIIIFKRKIVKKKNKWLKKGYFHLLISPIIIVSISLVIGFFKVEIGIAFFIIVFYGCEIIGLLILSGYYCVYKHKSAIITLNNGMKYTCDNVGDIKQKKRVCIINNLSNQIAIKYSEIASIELFGEEIIWYSKSLEDRKKEHKESAKTNQFYMRQPLKH